MRKAIAKESRDSNTLSSRRQKHNVCLISALFLVSASALSHESPITVLRESHAFYHKVTASYVYVYQIRYQRGVTKEPQVDSFYFNPAEEELYVCSDGKFAESGVCTDIRKRGMQALIKWTSADLEYGTRTGLVPVYILLTPPSVVIGASPPFSQSSKYVMYVGPQRVVACRTTVTNYTFEYEQQGQTVYMNSSKPADVEFKCEQRYPSP